MLAISFIILNWGDRSTYYYLYFLMVHLGGITHIMTDTNDDERLAALPTSQTDTMNIQNN